MAKISPSSVTQNGVTATLTISGDIVTVEVSRTDLYWRINGTNSGGDHGTYYISQNRNSSGSFEAEDDHDYAFQVASGGNWSVGAIFTVILNEDDGGGNSGGGDELGVYHLDVIVDDGIESVTVVKSWDHVNGNHGEDMSTGGWLYSMDDCIMVNDIKVKPGYTLNTYSILGLSDVPFQVRNLSLTSSGNSLSLTTPGNASITFSTTPQGLVYIDSGTKLEAYQVFIDNGLKWEQYIPYIDNGSGWDMCN